MKTTKNCKGCKEDFAPTSRHLLCPKCRHEAAPRKPCPECSLPILKKFSFCNSCSNRLRPRRALPSKPREERKKRINANGYVVVSTAERKNAFEHRLVMEEFLGRPLTSKETVHHKNGVKTDNRLSNLELWTSNHPSGTRVTDIYEWAIQIVNLYSEDYSHLQQYTSD